MRLLPVLLLVCLVFAVCGVAGADDGNVTLVSTELVSSDLTEEVTEVPTEEVTTEPTEEVTTEPTVVETGEPTEEVTTEPTEEVTTEPTGTATEVPTEEVTVEPTVSPTETATGGESNTTSETPATNLTVTVESTDVEENLTVLFESLTEETGNETLLSLTLAGGDDETNSSSGSSGSDGVSLTSSTNSTNLTGNSESSSDTTNTTVTRLLSRGRSYSTLSSTSESSGSGVVTLGSITVTSSGSTTPVSVNQSGGIAGGFGYSFDFVTKSYTITSTGSYRLDEDISTDNTFAIEILASDVTLDGNSHTITFTGSDNTGTSGVLIDSGASGVTVENIAGITGFEHGISAYGEKAVIENNTVYWNDYGIYSNNTSATIFGNNASSNIYGIWASGERANITDNIACFNNATGDGVVAGGYGIYSTGDDTIIQGNNASFNSVTASKSVGTVHSGDITVSATGGYGIYSEGDNVTIADNIASDNSASASIDYASAYTFIGINGNARSMGGYGIYSEGTNVTIADTVANNNSASASIDYASASASASNTFPSAVMNGNARSMGGYGIYSVGNNVTLRNTVANINSASASIDYASASAIAQSSASAVINGNASSMGGYGIYSEGTNVAIADTVANNNSASASIDYVSASASAPTPFASAVINGNASSKGGYGIYSEGTNVTIADTVANNNSASASLDYTSAIANAYAGSSDSVITGNANAIGGYGISSSGKDVDIFNNTALNNTAFSSIYYDKTETAGSGTAEIFGNAISTGGTGISSSGDRATIANNTAGYNSVNATITVGTVTGKAPITSTSFTGGFGINTTGNDATITGNRVSGNRYGIGISDSSTGLNLTGNRINQSTDGGLNISANGGGGDGSIYNNYFGSDLNVCATASSASLYHWNNTEPTLTSSSLTATAAPGTNVVGGKYLAGNYWSNATGNGWSDQQTPNETGYSLTPYEVTSGVYDENPLIGTLPTEAPTVTPTTTSTVSPTPTTTASPTVTPTVTPTATSTDDIDSYFADHTDTTADNPGIHFVIVTVTLPDGTDAGDTARLTLTLQNTGSIQLSPQARIVLAPANPAAQAIGEQPAVYRDGKYVITFLLQVPTEAGTYVYIFSPVQITRDPATGRDIRIPAGDPVQFTVTVGADRTVEVRSP